MHLKKIKLAAANGMIAYDAREAGDWVNPETHGETLNPAKTAENYAIGINRTEDGYEWMKVSPHAMRDGLFRYMEDVVERHKKTAGKRPRSDAVGFGSWVITLPEGVEEQNAQAFFEMTLALLKERYGDDCVICGFVHVDEQTPHMHVPVIPMIDGVLSAKRLFNRQDLQTIHNDFQRVAEEKGWTKYGIRYLLDESDTLQKAKSKMSREEMNALNAHIKHSVDAVIRTERQLLEQRSNTLEKRETAVKSLQNNLIERETAVKQQEEQLEISYNRRSKQLDEHEEELKQRVKQLEERERKLNNSIQTRVPQMIEATEKMLESADETAKGMGSIVTIEKSKLQQKQNAEQALFDELKEWLDESKTAGGTVEYY